MHYTINNNRTALINFSSKQNYYNKKVNSVNNSTRLPHEIEVAILTVTSRLL